MFKEMRPMFEGKCAAMKVEEGLTQACWTRLQNEGYSAVMKVEEDLTQACWKRLKKRK